MMNLCKPPDPVSFTGNIAQNWKDFEEQLHWFLAGTEAADKSDETKIGIMLSHAGKEAREVYKTLPWAATGDDKKFDKVTKAFQDYCEPRKNVLYERYCFWNLQQLEEESVDAYLTRLKIKVDSCDYSKEGWPPAVRMEMLRDRFVFGLQDDNLKERLLRESELNLTKAVEIAQRQESSKKQIKDMSLKASINAMSKKGHKSGHNHFICRSCGSQHQPKQCPAYGQICKRCKKPNHFAKVCRTKLIHTKTTEKDRHKHPKKVHVVEEPEQDTQSDPESYSSDDNYTLGMDPLRIDGLEKPMQWLSTVKTQSGKVTFKLDTGAEANVIPVEVFNQLTNTPTVQPTKTKLTAYGGTTIRPLGTCTLQCTSKHNLHHDIKFYIVSADSQPILGLRDCEKLGLVKRVNTIEVEELSKEALQVKYKEVFHGLGNLGKYHITLREGCTPVVHPARRVPHSLKKQLKQTLDANVKSGVLCKVDQPTDWVNNLVVVEKSNGSLRLCLDPKDLNKAIRREHHKIPTIQEISSELAGKSVFSTLDLKDGYWQIELDTESSLLCTFATPFGRYRFTRMPFGISSASEVFQKKNEAVFEGIPGIHIVADDIIIASSTVQEHDHILRQVLERAKERNVRFNFNKLQLRVPQVRYLGTIITADGMKPDPDKVKAIVDIPTPTDKADVRRLLGMINFLASHIPNMSATTAPLRDLLKTDVHFQWDLQHEAALSKIKEVISSAPVLCYFDPSKTSTIQADASRHGLGACLLQQGKPIAYASRSLTSSESNYAQIEKELLAIVFAAEKFHQFIYGFPTNVHSDHKPLESIFTKPLCSVPPRLQRMLLRLQKYDLSVKYVSGKLLHVADTLSRAHAINDSHFSTDENDMKLAVHQFVLHIPIAEPLKEELRTTTSTDKVLQQLMRILDTGWPSHITNVPQDVHEYWSVRNEIHAAENLLFMGDRLIVPAAKRSSVLQLIHEGHLGIQKCKARARLCVYWPNINDDIEKTVKSCSVCNKYGSSVQKEPMIPHKLPDRPWEEVGADYFTLHSQDFLLVVDYYSKYPEVIPMTTKTAEGTITALKGIFARHGIPNKLIADNMPFNSKKFHQFSKQCNFEVVTSSPTYPQSNGLAERNVQTVKKLLRKAKEGGNDEALALLELRNTPITGTPYSPAQLLMNRRLRGCLPLTVKALQPSVPKEVKTHLQNCQKKQKQYYDRHAKSLPPLTKDDVVRYQTSTSWEPAVITQKHSAPRSYDLVTTNGNVIRRNRRHLKPTQEARPTITLPLDDDDTDIPLTSSRPAQPVPAPSANTSQVSEKRTRSGRLVRPPPRYVDN